MLVDRGQKKKKKRRFNDDYFKKRNKSNYRKNKELSKRYQLSHETKPGETFSDFKRRMNKVRKSFN